MIYRGKNGVAGKDKDGHCQCSNELILAHSTTFPLIKGPKGGLELYGLYGWVSATEGLAATTFSAFGDDSALSILFFRSFDGCCSFEMACFSTDTIKYTP